MSCDFPKIRRNKYSRPYPVACRECFGCRMSAREALVRNMTYEVLSCYSQGFSPSFVTFTYSDKNLPRDASLHMSEIIGLRKRMYQTLRDKHIPQPVQGFKYMIVGEYGDQFGRCHLTIMVFSLLLALLILIFSCLLGKIEVLSKFFLCFKVVSVTALSTWINLRRLMMICLLQMVLSRLCVHILLSSDMNILEVVKMNCVRIMDFLTKVVSIIFQIIILVSSTILTLPLLTILLWLIPLNSVICQWLSLCRLSFGCVNIILSIRLVKMVSLLMLRCFGLIKAKYQTGTSTLNLNIHRLINLNVPAVHMHCLSKYLNWRKLYEFWCLRFT